MIVISMMYDLIFVRLKLGWWPNWLCRIPRGVDTTKSSPWMDLARKLHQQIRVGRWDWLWGKIPSNQVCLTFPFFFLKSEVLPPENHMKNVARDLYILDMYTLSHSSNAMSNLLTVTTMVHQDLHLMCHFKVFSMDIQKSSRSAVVLKHFGEVTRPNKPTSTWNWSDGRGHVTGIMLFMSELFIRVPNECGRSRQVDELVVSWVIGVAPVIIHSRLGFSLINHPYGGTPMTKETPN